MSSGGKTWPALVPLRPWSNKAWCPHKGPEICQDDILGTTYAANSIVSVDFNTDANTIATLKSRGYTVVCYASGGTFESWRDDSSKFPAGLLARKMSDWDENWLDIRSTAPYYSTLQSIMDARAQVLSLKKCDAIEWDNVDCWSNTCISGEKAGSLALKQEQFKYNKFLADTTHKYNMAVGLKNDIDQVQELQPYFDFAVNEECYHYNECDNYKYFTQNNKVCIVCVFMIMRFSFGCRLSCLIK